MSEIVDINDYLFTAETLPDEGANVRVRPEPVRAVSYGQGEPLPGPKLQDVAFTWAGALVVDATCKNGVGDPEAGLVHPDTIAQTPELFMSEANYQTYMNLI